MVGKSVFPNNVIDTLVSVEVKAYGVVYVFCSLSNSATPIAIKALFGDKVGIYVAAYAKCFVAFFLMAI